MIKGYSVPREFSDSFDKPAAPQPNTSESKKGENSLAERAKLFGKTVADNLLNWTLIKKKIFDLFFDYKQGNSTPRSTPTTPCNNYGNFAFPNVAGFQNYGYTGQTHVQQQNSQSSSGFQDYGYNNQTQPLQRCNQPLQLLQTPQDPYSPSPCDSNNSG